MEAHHSRRWPGNDRAWNVSLEEETNAVYMPIIQYRQKMPFHFRYLYLIIVADFIFLNPYSNSLVLLLRYMTKRQK